MTFPCVSATLEKALQVIGAHLGTREIWGSPAGASIFVNEKNVGKLPLPAPLRIAGESALLRACRRLSRVDANRTRAGGR